MFKVDLHTHSQASPDGGIRMEEYRSVLESNILDCIAITDHNRINFALDAQRMFGERIIVGEEILSSEGEIIGLYLSQPVPPDLSAKQTMEAIKDQGGLVYIPHPFETIRKGMHPKLMEELRDMIDIVEVCNGRAFMQNRSEQAVLWTKLNGIPGAASSDAHGIKGLGKTYTYLSELPTPKTLTDLLRAGRMKTEKPSMRSLLYPKYHRLRKKIGRTK